MTDSEAVPEQGGERQPPCQDASTRLIFVPDGPGEDDGPRVTRRAIRAEHDESPRGAAAERLPSNRRDAFDARRVAGTESRLASGASGTRPRPPWTARSGPEVRTTPPRPAEGGDRCVSTFRGAYPDVPRRDGLRSERGK